MPSYYYNKKLMSNYLKLKYIQFLKKCMSVNSYIFFKNSYSKLFYFLIVVVVVAVFLTTGALISKVVNSITTASASARLLLKKSPSS